MILIGNLHCPDNSFEKYLAKLNPDCHFLWQRTKNFTEEDYNPPIWYDNMVLGKNSLGHMMQNMSKDACLSKIYSNHCIRATCITLLDESGYEGRHIMTVSKHKSESSLKHYVSKAREKKKREMSHALSEHIIPQEPAVVNNSISSNSINLENVDFLEIGSQELNNMVMSVFEQSTAITQSIVHLTLIIWAVAKLHVLIKRMDVRDTVLVTVKLLLMIMVVKTKQDCLKLHSIVKLCY